MSVLNQPFGIEADQQGGSPIRTNVYAEEITEETDLVVKHVEDVEFGHRSFYGIRFFLKSPTELHHSTADDDRSAITLWARWTKAQGNDFDLLENLLENLLTQVRAGRTAVNNGITNQE